MKRRNAIRDKLIRKSYKYGLGGWIGREWGISRQRVHQIVADKRYNQNLGVLWGRVKEIIKGLIRGRK